MVVEGKVIINLFLILAIKPLDEKKIKVYKFLRKLFFVEELWRIPDQLSSSGHQGGRDYHRNLVGGVNFEDLYLCENREVSDLGR